jgi:Txe/YoeB family toxin of Txe-Axe toxin-antitoxin module
MFDPHGLSLLDLWSQGKMKVSESNCRWRKNQYISSYKICSFIIIDKNFNDQSTKKKIITCLCDLKQKVCHNFDVSIFSSILNGKMSEHWPRTSKASQRLVYTHLPVEHVVLVWEISRIYLLKSLIVIVDTLSTFMRIVSIVGNTSQMNHTCSMSFREVRPL